MGVPFDVPESPAAAGSAAMPRQSILAAIARAYMARERQRLGITAEERAAREFDTGDLVKRAQLAKLAQEMGFAPEVHERQGRVADATVRNLDEPNRLAAVPKPPTVGSFEDYSTTTDARKRQIEADRKGYMQADDRAPRINVMTPGAESNILNRLVTQWDKAIAPARELSRQAKIMETGLQAARRGDLAAGSQAVLVTFQKILDPTSVVRESEYARSAAGQALLARIQGFSERLQSGGAGVPLEELEKFAQLANEMVRASTGDYTRAVQNRIGRTADHYKINRDLVFDSHDFGAQAGVGGAPAGGNADPFGILGGGRR